jgi:hypothetical protein
MPDYTVQIKIKNKSRVISIISAGLFALFVLLIFLPQMIGLEGMNGGFAVSVLSFFFAITSLIVTLVYYRLARRFENILSGENLIAHWSYGREEWLQFTDKEYAYEKGKKRMLLVVMAIIIFVVFVIFSIIHPDTSKIMIFTALGLAALLAVFAFLVPWINYINRKKTPGEMYLSKNGIYIGGNFHVWGFLGSRLEKAGFDASDMMITLEYNYPTRTGMSTEIVHVPVPAAKIEEAKQAILRLEL